MSVQNAAKPVDAVDVEATWNGLTSSPRSQLVDVRTRAEWTYDRSYIDPAGRCAYEER
jgi:hypothetical protein